MSIETRLNNLEGSRPNKGKTPAERMTLPELNAALARIDRELKADAQQEAKRVKTLKAKLTPEQFAASESRRNARFDRDNAELIAGLEYHCSYMKASQPC